MLNKYFTISPSITLLIDDKVVVFLLIVGPINWNILNSYNDDSGVASLWLEIWMVLHHKSSALIAGRFPVPCLYQIQ